MKNKDDVNLYIEKDNKINNIQFCFHNNMSTIDAVNALIEEVTDNVDSKLKYPMVSLDLSKAFDTLAHNIRGVCLKLMKSYLFNRKQLVMFTNSNYHYYLYKWEFLWVLFWDTCRL